MKPSSESLFISHLLDRHAVSRSANKPPTLQLGGQPDPVETSPEAATQQQRLDNTSAVTSTGQPVNSARRLNSAPSQPVTLSINRHLLHAARHSANGSLSSSP